MPIDALLKQDSNGRYNIVLDENGDILNGDFFDTSLIISIYGERRASANEMPVAELRRGWIGNENNDYENGSKLWLYEQERITRAILNKITTEAENSVQWLIDDGFCDDIQVTAVVSDLGVGLQINIERNNSKISRFFQLWENTGVSNAA